MKKIIIIIMLISLIKVNIKAQAVKWYSFEQAVELNKQRPKKIFIDIYTDWCGWCKTMERNTFSNLVIVRYLNKYYYPVKFNAETKDTIHFANYVFVNKENSRRSAHQLAVALLKGKMSYPSSVYMDENNQPITAIAGYLPPEKIEPILYFIENDYYKKNIKYENFLKNFHSKFSTQSK